MARCKEELRAQGVTALPRTCPEHGIKGCPKYATEQRLSRSCDACRHGELAHSGLGEHQTGCRAIGCECKSYADPYANFTVLEDKVIPRKNGELEEMPKTFGELRKLVRNFDLKGVPDFAKLTLRADLGSGHELIDGNVDLRFQWWTVEES